MSLVVALFSKNIQACSIWIVPLKLKLEVSLKIENEQVLLVFATDFSFRKKTDALSLFQHFL